MIVLFVIFSYIWKMQPESDGSRSGSSLSLRNIAGNDNVTGSGGGGTTSIQSPTHRGVHRSISASSTKPSRRASSGAETLRKYFFFVPASLAIYFHIKNYRFAWFLNILLMKKHMNVFFLIYASRQIHTKSAKLDIDLYDFIYFFLLGCGLTHFLTLQLFFIGFGKFCGNAI